MLKILNQDEFDVKLTVYTIKTIDGNVNVKVTNQVTDHTIIHLSTIMKFENTDIVIDENNYYSLYKEIIDFLDL